VHPFRRAPTPIEQLGLSIRSGGLLLFTWLVLLIQRFGSPVCH
jgi:hypothetical protein